ncbi:MAG: hypothetical protein HRU19_12325 [Pseudobacteriovorax sp.]|nr:hypothetical protein [Pseudobacteriovorax sp.]
MSRKLFNEKIRQVINGKFGGTCPPSVYQRYFLNVFDRKPKDSTIRKIKGFVDGKIENLRKGDHDLEMLIENLLCEQGRKDLWLLFKNREGSQYEITNNVAEIVLNNSYFKKALNIQSQECMTLLEILEHKKLTYKYFSNKYEMDGCRFLLRMSSLNFISLTSEDEIICHIDRFREKLVERISEGL